MGDVIAFLVAKVMGRKATSSDQRIRRQGDGRITGERKSERAKEGKVEDLVHSVRSRVRRWGGEGD